MSVDAADRTRQQQFPDEARRVNAWASPAFWWRVAIVLVVLWGLVAGERRLAYFTTQSNVIVFAYFAGALYWMARRGTAAAPAPVLRGGVTTWILTTMVVSHVLLNHFENPIPGLFVADPTDELANRAIFAMHYVVPLMVLVDWVAFGPHRVVRWRDAAWWLAYPAAYGLVFLWRALALPEVPDRFPYPFLDTDALGAFGSLLEMLRVVAYIAVLGVLVMALDRLAWWVGERLRRVRRGAEASA
ncbi:Pr6Pr family membrane protein [Agromyces binzhouensis]|uniref:Pr6Pr family membrane protein n=1 Tax=Agromyces binzhouensis TaxID=1817495 RepID=UPI001A928391|nr:Pr6Pr family membrane protein [Agromyces binzhouensis]